MRVTNMAGVDLNVYTFDYDLTFVALLMNADGTIYHTLGGRDGTDALSHLAMPAFVRVLNETLFDHEAYAVAPRPPKVQPKLTIEKLKKRAENPNTPKCFHCHMVFDFDQQAAEKERRWKRSDAFRWPDPIQIGLRLDRDAQNKVASVVPGSPAAKAGIKPGEVIRSAANLHVRTFGDVQRALQNTTPSPTKLKLTMLRGDTEVHVLLNLKRNWRVPTPQDFAWRNTMWQMTPWPGFGGRELNADQKKNNGLPQDKWAMRVGYLVTWGPRAYTGRNAAQAGLRKHDIITSIGGKTDFESERHFQSWFRFHNKPGDNVKIELIRKGKKQTITLKAMG